MALALCLTLLPATALAEETEHAHCLCGKTQHVNIGDHTKESQITFDKWLASSVSTSHTLVVGGKGSSSPTGGDSLTVTDGKYVLEDGNYYLKTDVDGFESSVTIEHPIKIKGNVTICLNGKTLQSKAQNKPVFLIEGNSKLTLTDCTNNNKGKVMHFSVGTGSGVEVNGGTFNMYGGTITGNTTTQRGGGVCVTGASSAFNMYGGTISGNSATNGGGVYVESGKFTMNGNASVTGNNATTGNKKNPGNGGGVYVNSGTFTMNDNASITNNTTDGAEGGVGVYRGTSTATFTMNGGTISGNNAISRGGGVGVYGTDSAFIMNGGTITGNTATNGGGVFVKVTGGGVESGKFEMNGSASVSGNTATQNGGGVYVESGTFKMNDTASVSSNKAKNEKASNDTNGGGVFVNSGTFEMNGSASVKVNTADTYGGGVGVYGGTFNMNDGEISGNKAKNGGGGVYASSGQFNMNDGTISGNKANANGGGVFVHTSATFTVSLAPTVTGNTITTNRADSNVHLMVSAYITIGNRGLNDSASIGVTKTVDGGVFAKGSKNLTPEDAAKFKSDEIGYEVSVDTNKTQLVLTRTAGTHTHVWTYKATEATITATCTGTGNCDFNKDGGSVTITKPANLTHDGNPKTAEVTVSNDWQGPVKKNITITYWKSDNGGNTYKKWTATLPPRSASTRQASPWKTRPLLWSMRLPKARPSPSLSPASRYPLPAKR